MLENGESSKQMLIEDSIGRKILDSAIDIINQEGYENLTIRKVAKESGCSNSAIYMRFEDKDALARAVAALHAKPFLMLVDDNYRAGENISQNINRIARAQLDKVLEMDLEAVNMHILYLSDMIKEENPFLLKAAGYLKEGAARGEIRNGNFLDMAYALYASFWGLAYMIRANKDMTREQAYQLLEVQNTVLINGIRMERSEDTFWDILKDKGVDVDKALERMKGNKDAYKSFLVEFFEDPDFEALKESIDQKDAREAFDYAHGLKGMAANLGLDGVHNALSVLVEILRQGSLEGAAESYGEVMAACDMITVLL